MKFSTLMLASLAVLGAVAALPREKSCPPGHRKEFEEKQ
jgi:hypothetical protein